jgi:uncharacterized protein YndB with AHSA1/START domain
MTAELGQRPAGRLHIVSVGDRQIVMTRRFAAPPLLVFDALVTPSLLLQWMHGPAGWWMVNCKFDATEGGHYRYEWRGPNGRSMAAKGVVRQIIRPSRLVTVELFDDNWTGGEVTAVVELTADGAGTLLTNTATYPSPADRDAALASGMELGVEAGYTHLDRLLSDHQQGAQR